MSRHELESNDPEVRVTVGWDPPLNTYFAQVFRDPELVGGEGDEVELVWRGFGTGLGDQILNLVELRGIVQAWITHWPEDLDEKLVLDRHGQR